MCNPACVDFAMANLTSAQVKGKFVLEVGSLNVNGSVRKFVETLEPGKYIGVDIVGGPGVDLVCRADELLQRFEESSVDLLVSTEMLEHVRDWRRVVTNFKHVLRPGGSLLLTTRSYGFGYHGFPYDFWRFELSDLRKIFADFTIENLEPDPLSPGVFLKARKSGDFIEQNSDVCLFSIISNRRVFEISKYDFYMFQARYHVQHLIDFGIRIPRFMRRMILQSLHRAHRTWV